MIEQTQSEPKNIDYLVLGHLTRDIHPDGYKLGGTVSYASLTARAFGLNVGIYTACAEDLELEGLDGIQVVKQPSPLTTTFENIYNPEGRSQFLHERADELKGEYLPEVWKKAGIVHFGPVCSELTPDLLDLFPASKIGLTPQGWLRSWDKNKKIYPSNWKNPDEFLSKSDMMVISIEDIQYNERIINEWADKVSIIVLTRSNSGASLFWNGKVEQIPPVEVTEIDPTGAGDIFAASFFIHYEQTRNPVAAAWLANQIAAISVTRSGLKSIPDQQEINQIKKRMV